jgi:hypothetical protein
MAGKTDGDQQWLLDRLMPNQHQPDTHRRR